jgi:carbon-monoxide dehydrogenase small subunit
MNGRLVNSCLTFAIQARNKELTTIEAIGTEKNLHPLQEAFMKWNACQCGFCIPAMILTTKLLLDHSPNPSEQEIKASISGILCRCTGYYKIIQAVKSAAVEIRGND